MSRQGTKAYWAGYRARLDGISDEANPFDCETADARQLAAADDWERGW